MSCRRCSTCNLNYPAGRVGPCGVCHGTLSFFANAEPTEDLDDAIARIVWQSSGEFRLYGGATMMERFQKTLLSLRGADDFLVECGDWPAPVGNDDWGGGGRDVLGPPAP